MDKLGALFTILKILATIPAIVFGFRKLYRMFRRRK